MSRIEEYFEIANELQVHHSIFSFFWKIGRPRFVDNIPTAQVSFDKKGHCIDYQFSEKFWDSLTSYERKFVICHEILHVILNHGERIKDIKPMTHTLNVALDIPINHLLIDKFGFDRNLINNYKDYCWLDTVFPEDKTVLPNQSFEYYYNILIKNKSEIIKNKTIVDDHSNLPGIPPESINETFENAIDNMSQEEKNSLYDALNSPAGNGIGDLAEILNINYVAPKKKWETVIKDWSKTFMSNFDKTQEQWAKTNRRFTFLKSSLLLPSETDDVAIDEDKVEVWFFQDTSGSCSGYRKRFFTAALSLPQDFFKVRMFCFDTKVYETTLESKKIYGGGGTSFSIIESFIQKTIKNEKTNYPKAIFLITDGYGNSVSPKIARNWYWFLTPNGSKSYIPTESNYFDLSKFE